ncbi:PilZ domain-containing protein [Erythrobacter sp. THAF29]|uniref:PilZ domain-containing protein n=1 Tax=Erythrobacter sp. THAF29 TaxID=2587851 RepID=UPI0012A9A0FA|nr:PilZ domain-containing protein [Erythrobacter sp. THAF29]QFT77742.1 PilZ domain protein [Erythrobacter sp. THAF29]
MNMHSIPRAAERRSLHIMVKSRVKSRVVFCDLIDISEGGCKLRGSSGFANVGDRVTMKVDGVNAPLGVIAWIEGKLAGVAFEGQMHGAVIDHLIREHEMKLMEERKEDNHRRL